MNHHSTHLAAQHDAARHDSGHDAPADHQTAHASAEHDRHAGHSVAMFRDKLWLSLALSIPVFIWSPDPQAWLGYGPPIFPGSD